jgi:Fe-S-cluster containining protein
MVSKDLPIIGSCEGCGVCCLHMVHPPFKNLDADDGEHSRLNQQLQSELKEKIRKIANSAWPAPCFWLDMETMQCMHYEERPEVCRRYERGSSECRSVREFFAEEINSQ